jgi:transcription termination/antitermination protein NusG
MTNWYCLYVKRGHEDDVSTTLISRQGIEVLNPKIRRRKLVRSKWQAVEEQLFPSYIFSRLKPERHFHLVRYTRGVRQLVGNRSGEPYKVDQHTIDFLKEHTRDGFIVIDQPKINRGDKVRVQEGPFLGLEGEILFELKPNERVMILLSTLELHAKIELPVHCLARI